MFKMSIPIAAPAYCRLSAVPGQQYYLLCDGEPGVFASKPVFQLVERSIGESRIYTVRQKEPLQ